MSTAFTTLKIALLAPIARARVNTHTPVNPGSFARPRNAKLTSRGTVSRSGNTC